MGTNNKASVIVSEDLKKQREFISKINQRGFDFGIVISEAFVRGMRDLGYKSTGTALDELVDNSIQAEASQVHIVFGYYDNNKSKKKPNMLAIIDDGHGMDPEMIRIASIWGGTHREGDRKGFGRYGYGLPSASVSIGKQFKVYSKVFEDEWHQVTMDVDEIGEGKYLDENGKVVVPPAKKTKLPEWVNTYIKTSMKNLDHGTVILIDKIDRLDYSTIIVLKDFLLQHFGLIYRNYLRKVKIVVDGMLVEGIDPLFLTPGLRYYDEDDERATALPELLVEVKDKETRTPKGIIKVRYSQMPPTFGRIPEDKPKERGKNNQRFDILKENNGIIILRTGRQIDVVNSRCPWTKFQNLDFYLGIEIDFPPSLDEEFSITTSKQQVVPKERIWDILKEYGVLKTIQDMRAYRDKEIEKLKKIREEGEQIKKRASEQAMEDAKKFLENTKKVETPEQQKKKLEDFEKEVKERSKITGKPEEEIKKELDFEIKSRPYKIEEEEMPGAPFYRVKQLGGQVVLFINKSHRFYSQIYMGKESTPRLRGAIEILLLVLGDSELSSVNERKLFYETERIEWSKQLNIVLDRYSQWDGSDDNSASLNEYEFVQNELNKN